MFGEQTFAQLRTGFMYIFSACSPPPLIDRTTVTHTATSTHDIAHYSCSVSTDVLVRGTVDVDCANGASWPVATILCARECFDAGNNEDVLLAWLFVSRFGLAVRR